MSISDLPLVNACLNFGAAMFLLCGYAFIRRGNQIAHRNCMLVALVFSAVFLCCYLYYHAAMKRMYGKAHTPFLDPQWFRPIYLTILSTHLVGAILIVPMVVVTISHALRARFDRHKRIARWTWPVWMYVSVTGVVIYVLLYQVFPQR
jgi:uncharacterized membrane protein YozB (DUF420 family)